MWDDKQAKGRKKRHVNKEAKSLEIVLQVISNNNPNFSADIINRITTNNTHLQNMTIYYENADKVAVCKNIVVSVQGLLAKG